MKIFDLLDFLGDLLDLWNTRWWRLYAGILLAALAVFVLHHQYGDRPWVLYASIPSAIIIATLGAIWQVRSGE